MLPISCVHALIVDYLASKLSTAYQFLLDLGEFSPYFTDNVYYRCVTRISLLPSLSFNIYVC